MTFSGSIVALVTPMKASGAIDWVSLQRLIDWHIDMGSDALVITGTTGEGATLDDREQLETIERAVQYADKRLPIVAGTGSNCTKKTVSMTKNACALGVDGALIVTPYYNKPTQQGLYHHFMTIAESVDIPQILYNVPSRTAVDLLPEVVVKLSEVSPIVGIKEATGDLERAAFLVKHCRPGFCIYSGDDVTAARCMLTGGQGNISVTANLIPKGMAQLCQLALAGNVEETLALNARFEALHKMLFCVSNPIPVKWALQQMGMIDSGIRLPLTQLDKDYHKSLVALLIEHKLIREDNFLVS